MKKAVSIVVNVIAWIVLILAFLTTLIVFSSGRNNGVATRFNRVWILATPTMPAC